MAGPIQPHLLLVNGPVASGVTRLCGIPVTIVKAVRAEAGAEYKSVPSSDWWYDTGEQRLKQETTGQEPRLAG